MIQKPKGTKDLLPSESYKWQEVERKVKKVLDSYNFKEIRLPVFEQVLQDAGVFKNNEDGDQGWDKFITALTEQI